MLKVGITGGMGSGKTTVCALFELLGIPVYYADEAARALMTRNRPLRDALQEAFGAQIYQDDQLNRAALSKQVFGHPEKLAQLNALVHPVVQADAAAWMAAQQAPYVLKEAALFFESGSHVEMDMMIGVSAPRTLRIARSMSRSGLSRKEVESRIASQMDAAEKVGRCDFVIVNDEEQALLPQVLQIDELLRSVHG